CALPIYVGEQVVELAAGVLVEIEERGDRRGDLRLGAEAGEVGAAQAERLEQRLVEQAGEALVHPRLAEAHHELLHPDAVDLERGQEERELDGALALLDEAQVRR